MQVADLQKLTRFWFENLMFASNRITKANTVLV